MKTYIKRIITCSLLLTTMTACLFDDLPVDEDGLLITHRSECYVSNFELLGLDYRTVRANQQMPAIDTLACTIDVLVKWGTDLRNVYPQFTLCPDAKLDPKITGVTDFSDLANPRKYTVISGNRRVSKTYTVNITVQER